MTMRTVDSRQEHWPGSGIEPPMPVLPARPHLESFARHAWQLAAQHVTHREGVPHSPFMDEGFDPETLWIWDTCFMAHYAALAPDVFPGIESLENFYAPLHEGRASSLVVHHSDNPPLFAWTEWEYLQHTGDLAHVEQLLDRGVLQRHHQWFATVGPGVVPPGTRIPTAIEHTPHGFRWNGVCSGMDNTPRAPLGDEHGTFGRDVLWLDALAQLALDARCLALLAAAVGREALAEQWRRRHQDLVAQVQDQHWDAAQRCFVDRVQGSGERAGRLEFSTVVTPASFWPVLAGAATAEQVEAMAGRLRDPMSLGGAVPWPSVERRHPDFRPTGHYWRGGVWVPMAYMGAAALARCGYHQLAHETTLRLVEHMALTWQQVEPHTVWEAYSPTQPLPATGKDDRERVRPDFCGWSALAPTAMLVEHVLGLRVDALAGRVEWRRHLQEPHGITGLRCGSTMLDLHTDGGRVTGRTSAPVELVVDGRTHHLSAGRFDLPG